MEHDAALAEALAELFATRDALEWEHLLIPRGIGCVQASADTPGAFYRSDEQMRASGLVVEADHPVFGRTQRWGPTVRFSAAPDRFGGGTYAGQDTDTILAELGCSEAETAELRAPGRRRLGDAHAAELSTRRPPAGGDSGRRRHGDHTLGLLLVYVTSPGAGRLSALRAPCAAGQGVGATESCEPR